MFYAGVQSRFMSARFGQAELTVVANISGKMRVRSI